MAKKQQRFTQRPTVFEPTEAEIDAVLADVFEAMDKAEADRLAREQHALEMLATDAVGEDEQQPEVNKTCWNCGGTFGGEVSYWPNGNPHLCPVCGGDLHDDGESEDEHLADDLSERAQVVEDAVREDVERQNDEKHCAAIDIDGQQVGEADIRRLIRKVQSLTTALMLSHFSLNQANADIAALQRAVAGRPVAAFKLTRKGYDSTRDMGV